MKPFTNPLILSHLAAAAALPGRRVVDPRRMACAAAVADVRDEVPSTGQGTGVLIKRD